VAAAAGDEPAADRRRLAHGLVATALAAWSAFAALVGLGTWLIGSPAPPWIPWRAGWIAFLLASAIAVVPLWWRRLAPLPVTDA
jgi:hypothetical protein